jgi:very-long-chain enoyl-CoA reductase
MSLSIQSRSGKELLRLPLQGPGAVQSVDEVKEALLKSGPRVHPLRQRLTVSSTKAQTSSGRRVLESGHLLEEYGISGKGASADYVVNFKDLGPQVSWRGVFIAEYLGPLVLLPIVFTLELGKGDALLAWSRAHRYQKAALVAWTIHFAKRELETLFVHRFSNATMPWRNLVKNCVYYWGFATYVAYFVGHPQYTPVTSHWQFWAGWALFGLGELGNLVCHWQLRQLRPPGTRIRQIPHGLLFEYVSCPNYTCEVVAWLGFNLMTQTIAGILFMMVGTAQMMIWANGKHRSYLKEFGAVYPHCRKRMIPFLW